MLESQKVLVQLLREIDEECQSHHLRYYLYGETALSCFRSEGFESESSSLDIAMTLNDALKLRRFLKRKYPETRAFDSIYDNSKFRGMRFFYVDKGTTRINLNHHDGRKAHGLAVCINILLGNLPVDGVSNPSLTPSWVMKLLTGKYEVTQESLDLNLASAVAHDTGSFMSLRPRRCDKKVFRKMMLNQLTKSQESVTTEDSLFVLPDHDDEEVCVFEPDELTGRQLVFFENQATFLPKNHIQYFMTLFGPQWEDVVFDSKWENNACVVDAALPYEHYLDYLKQHDLELLPKSYVEEEDAIRDQLKDYSQTINSAWMLVKCTGARLQLSEKYAPIKEDIIAFYREGNWKKLSELLADYDEVARVAYRNGVALRFDDELFDIYCDYAYRMGRYHYVKVLKDFANEKELKSFDMKTIEMEQFDF